MANNISIPRKSLFKLDEVCSLTGVKPYVLRFWESEFEQISPLVSSSGQKLFEHKDIEAVLEIKELLFEQKMTIEKAKMIMDQESVEEEASHAETVIAQSTCEDIQSLSQGDGFVEIKAEEETPQAPHMSEDFLSELDEAKVLLKDIISRTEGVQTTHNWI